MSLWDFARLSGSESLGEADQASRLATALRTFAAGADLALTPGAGLIRLGGRLRLFVFADVTRVGLEPGRVLPLSEVPTVAERVAAALATFPERAGEAALAAFPDWMGEALVMPIFAPQRHLAPADPITGSLLGTIGTQVRWHSGIGFVTAGHVAHSVGATVYDGATAIGQVVWSNDPAGHGTAVEPDLAVVELAPGVALSGALSGATTAGSSAVVSVTSSGASATIMGFSQFLFMPSQHATIGDTYFTTAQVTQPGDSGGPVMLAADLIGHVVGASPGMTSFVQDVTYQLREAANPLRNGLPGLRM